MQYCCLRSLIHDEVDCSDALNPRVPICLVRLGEGESMSRELDEAGEGDCSLRESREVGVPGPANVLPSSDDCEVAGVWGAAGV